jgi:hypothetical protein
MKRELNPTFTKALAAVGRKTTPEELTKRGVNRLRTYKISEISLLIERALNKTLAERTLSPLPAEEMAQLSLSVEREFKQQLGKVDQIRASQGTAKTQQDSAKRELAAFREKVKRGRSTPAAPSDKPKLLQDIGSVLKPLADQSSGPDWLTNGVSSDIQKLIEARSAQAVEAERKVYLGEIGNLERRIAKLMGTTESMEKALGKLANAKEPDIGIASIYRTTQGITLVDSEEDQKSEMMKDIFKANMVLHNQIELGKSA